MAARLAGNWALAGQILPEVLVEARVLAGSGDPRAAVVHIRACVASSLAVRLLGFIDLARLLAERAERHAVNLGDPECQSAAAYALALSVLSGGAPQRSMQIAASAADSLPPAGADAVRGWAVMPHLAAALAAGSLGRPDVAAPRLAEAATIAASVETDPWHTEPSQANAGVWRVTVALENGDPESAPDLARQVDRSTLRSAIRQAQLVCDAGRGWFARGDHERCVRSLLEADRIYPLVLWNRPQALEIVGQMARDSRQRGGSSELQALCARVGIDPLAPPAAGHV